VLGPVASDQHQLAARIERQRLEHREPSRGACRGAHAQPKAPGEPCHHGDQARDEQEGREDRL
jgi:hypothetical protein